MAPVIDMGGHPLTISEDKYPDGRKCVVAEHTDLEGCVAYGANLAEALEGLKEARSAILSADRRRTGSPTPIQGAQIVRTNTANSGKGELAFA
jgi:predicted RNase H-like HicB family nuclease